MINWGLTIDKKRLLAIGVVGVLILLVFLNLSFGMINKDMVPVYDTVSMSDRYGIIRLLSNSGVEYSVTDNNILVPARSLKDVRIFLASEGYPSGSSIVGYEIFNKEETLNASGFNKDINFYRALEGEITRSIMSLKNVKSARVHLVPPKREPFRRSVQKPTASVVLGLHPMHNLSPSEIKAIAHLVASAVPLLSFEDITIVSTEGKSLKLPMDSENTIISSESQEYQLKMEKYMRGIIEEIVGKIVGANKVRANVSLDIDFEEVHIDAEKFDPSGQVLRSNQVHESHEKGTSTGGSVSVANNIPAEANVPAGSDVVNSNDQTDETKNFDISKEHKRVLRKGGGIKKISAAVLLDGEYEKDPTTGEEKYMPRSQAMMNSVRTIVESALGIESIRGDKIEVMNMRFAEEQPVQLEETPDFWERHLYEIIVLSSILLTTIIISLLVLKPMVYRLIDAFRVVEHIVEDDLITEDAEIALTADEEEERRNEELIKNRNDVVTQLNELAASDSSSVVSLLRLLSNEDDSAKQ